MSSIGSNSVPYVIDLDWKRIQLPEGGWATCQITGGVKDDGRLDKHVSDKLKPLIDSVNNVLNKAQSFAVQNPEEFALRKKKGEFKSLVNGKKEEKLCHIPSLGSVRTRFLIQDVDAKLAEIPKDSKKYQVLLWVLNDLYLKMGQDSGVQAALCVSEGIEQEKRNIDVIGFYKDFYNTPLLKSMAYRCIEQIK